MVFLLAILIGLFAVGYWRYLHPEQFASSDSVEYLLAATESRLAIQPPCNTRWVLPRLIGPSIRIWRIASLIALATLGPLFWLWLVANGATYEQAFIGEAILCGSFGLFRIYIEEPIMLDPFIFVGGLFMGLLSFVLPWWSLLPLAIAFGSTKDLAAPFAAFTAHSWLPLLGLLGFLPVQLLASLRGTRQLVGVADGRSGVIRHYQTYFAGIRKRLQSLAGEATTYLMKINGLIIFPALTAMTPEATLALLAGVLLCIIAVDGGRVLTYFFPPLILAAVTSPVIPAYTWYPLVVWGFFSSLGERRAPTHQAYALSRIGPRLRKRLQEIHG